MRLAMRGGDAVNIHFMRYNSILTLRDEREERRESCRR